MFVHTATLRKEKMSNNSNLPENLLGHPRHRTVSGTYEWPESSTSHAPSQHRGNVDHSNMMTSAEHSVPRPIENMKRKSTDVVSVRLLSTA